jgi:hypothetical protein
MKRYKKADYRTNPRNLKDDLYVLERCSDSNFLTFGFLWE